MLLLNLCEHELAKTVVQCVCLQGVRRGWSKWGHPNKGCRQLTKYWHGTIWKLKGTTQDLPGSFALFPTILKQHPSIQEDC